MQKILIAEDEARFRHELGQSLMQHGYQVVSVQDGYQALEFAIREQPDLLILDVHMPAGDGFSVHDRVRLHPEIAVRPVIYMTHEPTADIRKMADEHGAVALLQKPFDMDGLLETIRTTLSCGHADAA